MKWLLWGLVILVIAFQGYRFSGNFNHKPPHSPQTFLTEKPCRQLEQYPPENVSRFPILLSNCWPVLKRKGRYQKDALFPLDFARRFRNLQKVYDVALNNRRNTVLDSQDQAILSTMMSGDEMRRIQGLYFLCSYPSLISKINWSKDTQEQQFNFEFLQACSQNFTEKTGLKYYLSLSKEEQSSRFLENFIP